jgi:hypothetical protein
MYRVNYDYDFSAGTLPVETEDTHTANDQKPDKANASG